MPLLMLFFFNDTATTEIYTLSLHDALPIYQPGEGIDDGGAGGEEPVVEEGFDIGVGGVAAGDAGDDPRGGQAGGGGQLGPFVQQGFKVGPGLGIEVGAHEGAVGLGRVGHEVHGDNVEAAVEEGRQLGFVADEVGAEVDPGDAGLFGVADDAGE